jgi:hypothetical protein
LVIFDFIRLTDVTLEMNKVTLNKSKPILNRKCVPEKKTHVKKYKADFSRNSLIYNLFILLQNPGRWELRGETTEGQPETEPGVRF